jgi:hypothetical protein
MTVPARRRNRAVAVLLVVAAALFVIGVTSEANSDTHADERAADATAHREPNGAAETARGEAAEHAERGGEPEAAAGEERVLGIDVESPLLVTAAVVVSLLLATLVLRRPDRRLLLVVAALATAFAVLDVAEITHQIHEDRAGLAALATVIAALHTAAAAVAIQWVAAREVPGP